MNVKVQFLDVFTIQSVKTSGTEKAEKYPLTMIAFSDVMKARVLEMFMKKEKKMHISFTTERQTGEWHEEMIENSLQNY